MNARYRDITITDRVGTELCIQPYSNGDRRWRLHLQQGNGDLLSVDVTPELLRGWATLMEQED